MIDFYEWMALQGYERNSDEVWVKKGMIIPGEKLQKKIKQFDSLPMVAVIVPSVHVLEEYLSSKRNRADANYVAITQMDDVRCRFFERIEYGPRWYYVKNHVSIIRHLTSRIKQL